MDFKYNDAVISIIASQENTDKTDSDGSEIMTTGSYYKKNGKVYISYCETDDNGLECFPTIVQVENSDRVVVTREGAGYSSLEIVRGERRHSVYKTSFGELLIGISHTIINSTLCESGGSLKLEYDLDINNAMASHNSLKIDIRVQQ